MSTLLSLVKFKELEDQEHCEGYSDYRISKDLTQENELVDFFKEKRYGMRLEGNYPGS